MTDVTALAAFWLQVKLCREQHGDMKMADNYCCWDYILYYTHRPLMGAKPHFITLTANGFLSAELTH